MAKLRRNSRAGNFSGNHQRCWLWGRHAVTETLLKGIWAATEIYVTQQAFDRHGELLSAKQQAGIPLEIVTNERLRELSKSSEHQGYLVRMSEFPYLTLSEFLPRLQNTAQALVVICDRLQDAFNFGAILRCCDGTQVAGVIVGEHAQAGVTPHVARSSSGAVNYVPIVKTNDLVAAATTLRQQGLQLVAADANTATHIWDSLLNQPTALLIGSEAHGVAPELLAVCDARVSIPMLGQVTSLNAAVAAGILMYEIRRQQHTSPASD